MAIYKVISPVGKFKDNDVYNNEIQYITQTAKTPSGYISLCGVTSIDNAASEMREIAKRFGKDKGTRIRHSVLSFDPEDKITPKVAGKIALSLINFYDEQGYQIVSAVHEDKEYLHIHIVMNTVNSCDGYKYKGKKKEYYTFIAHTKAVLKKYAIKLYNYI